MGFDTGILLLIPGLLIGLWAQFRVKSTFSKFSKVHTLAGIPASQSVADMLRRENMGGVKIERTSGTLTDHFDPGSDTLRLSDSVFASDSVAALGIAAHEAGHALQKMDNYAPLAIRSAVVPSVKIGSNLAWPIFLVGLIANWEPLMFAGIVLFALVVLFSLISLPVEFDASRRALKMLSEGGYITEEERTGVKRVLSAAAMTYVATAIAAILQLLRLLLLANGRRRR
jgi:uncharacterized protein